MARELAIEWLGTVPYREALELQEKCVEARRAGAAADRLLLLEHPPVITLGRGARSDTLLASGAELAARGIDVHRVSRGGDITYHAPGQLVGYLILDLAGRGERDVHAFLRSIEAMLEDALSELGVPTRTLSGYTGLFVRSVEDEPAAARPRKIASIGVGVRGWVTYHGFALNVDPDLSGFDAIIPCGLDFVEMTSIARELAGAAQPDLAARARAAVGAACAFAGHAGPGDQSQTQRETRCSRATLRPDDRSGFGGDGQALLPKPARLHHRKKPPGLRRPISRGANRLPRCLQGHAGARAARQRSAPLRGLRAL
jgi:lipoate-protein ligase B